MKKIIALVMVILFILNVTACKSKNDENEELKPYPDVQQLIKSRKPYIGDINKDYKILSLLKIGEKLGDFKTELQTNKEPYSIKLIFQNKVNERDKFDSQMQKYAFIILALIDNANEVQWSYPYDEDNKEVQINVSVKKEDAKIVLGMDIKEFGKSASQLQELVDRLQIRN